MDVLPGNRWVEGAAAMWSTTYDRRLSLGAQLRKWRLGGPTWKIDLLLDSYLT
jgi:hypothetical protein